jgi:deazaflavin-dependent oxidoreductase (nitroreductase family)
MFRLALSALLLPLSIPVGFYLVSRLVGGDWLTRALYPRGRPRRITRLINASWGWLVSMGLVPSEWPGKPVSGPATLEVRGRRTGKARSTMATWVEVDGERYFVSMLGPDSEWVKNVRSAAGAAFLRRGRRRRVILVEVAPERRAPIIRAWFQRTWRSTGPHLGVSASAPLSEFEQIAPQHPVFRIVDPGDVGPPPAGGQLVPPSE